MTAQRQKGELVRKSAIISPCGMYRSMLKRMWGSGEMAVFFMLNPSVADADIDDPTIRRCMGFARAWGLDGVAVVNLFQYRTAYPKELALAKVPLNLPSADEEIRSATAYSSTLIAAWGAVPKWAEGRANEVAGIIHGRGKRLYSLGTTKAGHPRHPLYLPKGAVPQIWSADQEGELQCDQCGWVKPVHSGGLEAPWCPTCGGYLPDDVEPADQEGATDG